MDAVARDALEVAHQTIRACLERCSDQTTAFPGALVCRTRTLPEVWTLNQVRVTEPADPDAVAELAQQHQADLAFRHLVIEDPATGAAAEALLAAQDGWRVEHDVVMRLGDRRPASRSGIDVVELSVPEMLELMSCWFSQQHPDVTADTAAQLSEYQRREHRAFDEQIFGVRDTHGTALGLTKLRMVGEVAWVEDVFTRPEARRRGFARALVTRAVLAALELSPVLVFLEADADDWPQHLYADLGFEPLAPCTILHRTG